MAEEQYDVLILHYNGNEECELATRLLTLLTKGLGVNEEVKAISAAELDPGDRFLSMEDALRRSSWVFILITANLLSDSCTLFSNNQALLDSLLSDAGNKYVPVYRNRQQMSELKTPSYIKVITGCCLEDLERQSGFARSQLKRTIEKRLLNRKERERSAERRYNLSQLIKVLRQELQDLKYKYERQKAQDIGDFEKETLARKYRQELELIASQKGLSGLQDLQDFAEANDLDLSDLVSSEAFKFHELTLSEGPDTIHNVDAKPSHLTRNLNPTEDDEAMEDEVPPPYHSVNSVRTESTYPVAGSPLTVDGAGAAPPQMYSAKDSAAALMPPPLQSLQPENVGRASPLPVPLRNPTDSYNIPAFLSEFNSIHRSQDRDPDNDSMFAEAGDTSSIITSQSQANLTDYEGLDADVDERSCESSEEEMDTGEHQVDLSLVALATGERPLRFESLNVPDDNDGGSMIVEVASTVGESELNDDSAMATPADTPQADQLHKEPNFKDPPLRVMHRSYCGETLDDLDDSSDPVGPDEDDPPLSPGLASLNSPYSWPGPRIRRGSASERRPIRRTNLTTQKFLSLSSIQSLSSKLFRLHQQPSLNDIREWSDRPPRLLDGIRLRYS